MKRLLFYAGIALAVFSCTYGGSDSATSDSTTINTSGNNAAMGDSSNHLGGSTGTTGTIPTIDSGFTQTQPAMGSGTDTGTSTERMGADSSHIK